MPAPEGEDELKRKQLMELAIINGTYRSATQQQQQVAAQLAAAAAAGKAAGAIPTAVALQAAAVAAQARGQLQQSLQLQQQLRSPGLAGAPIIMSPSTAAARGAATATSTSMAQLQQQQLQQQQQVALLQQHQQAEAYQQLLLGYVFSIQLVVLQDQIIVKLVLNNNKNKNNYERSGLVNVLDGAISFDNLSVLI